jgi:hypothetical protein
LAKKSIFGKKIKDKRKGEIFVSLSVGQGVLTFIKQSPKEGSRLSQELSLSKISISPNFAKIKASPLPPSPYPHNCWPQKLF